MEQEVAVNPRFELRSDAPVAAEPRRALLVGRIVGGISYAMGNTA